MDVLDPKRISASRLGTAAGCGKAFEFKYVLGVDPGRSSSHALFGLVMHRAREQWVMNRKLIFPRLVEDAWFEVTRDDKPTFDFLTAYRKLSLEARAEEQRIFEHREAIGKPVTKVRSTKDWKESEIFADITALFGAHYTQMAAESHWRFSPSDPLPNLYDESLALAQKYSDQWKHLPNSIATELGFEFTWVDGFILKGYIDEVAPLLDRNGKRFGTGVIDAKTYSNEPAHTGKDSRQLTLYDLGLRYLVFTGALDPSVLDYPIYHGIDLMRFLEYRWYQVGRDGYVQLHQDLCQYERMVEHEVYIPAAKSCRAEFCDFKAACENWHGSGADVIELGQWSG